MSVDAIRFMRRDGLGLGFRTRCSHPTASLIVPRGRHYVGEPIRAVVQVVAGADRPFLKLGSSDAVDVAALGGVEVHVRSSSTIGTATETTNLYRFPVRIVAKRAGTHAVPTIRATVDGREVAATPAKITALVPPAAGRTSTFLGGIGRATATAEARPDSVRLGDSFEYRLTLEGPGSVGSDAPTVSHEGWRVDPLPADSVVDPPSRTFRYRVRPDRPGPATIPPVRIATFDPASLTYQTTAANGVKLRVVDVAEFDPSRVTVSKADPPRGRTAMAFGAAGLAVAAASLRLAKWRARRARRVNLARIAVALADGLRTSRGHGDAVNAALAEFFRVGGGRPPGALTPGEAADAALAMTDSEGLARRAAKLVAACDESAYAINRNSLGVRDALGTLVDRGTAVRRSHRERGIARQCPTCRVNRRTGDEFAICAAVAGRCRTPPE